MAEARIRFSVKDGTFEIEGPESFVSAQLVAFGDIFRKALSEPIKPSAAMSHQAAEAQGVVSSQTDDYSSVLAIHEGKVKVLTNIPGAKNKEKTINAALLCLFGRLKEGVDTIPFDDIREICKDHNCYDSPNFSKYLKSDKQAFVISGSRGKQMVKLSSPGRKRAEALVRQLVSEAK
jgi:hypothetical protein